jgi:predicted RNA-binding protein
MLAYADKFEVETPIRKRKGPFILSEESLFRPEVTRHQQRLLERYQPPSGVKKLLLLPEENLRPFRELPADNGPVERLERRTDVHICSYGLTYAIVPQELLDVYPLSQTETALTPTPTATKHARIRMVEYLKRFHYSRCVIVVHEQWQEQIAESIKKKFKGKIRVQVIKSDSFDAQALRTVLKALK